MLERLKTRVNEGGCTHFPVVQLLAEGYAVVSRRVCRKPCDTYFSKDTVKSLCPACHLQWISLPPVEYLTVHPLVGLFITGSLHGPGQPCPWGLNPSFSCLFSSQFLPYLLVLSSWTNSCYMYLSFIPRSFLSL